MARPPRVVLGVSGGIAAYKAVELCRHMVDAGYFVSPILTDSAKRFVGEATFAALASEPPRSSLWEAPEPSPHTLLGQRADLIVVAPATARIIASYALGLSDDLLATTLLATRAPVVLCPAMHAEMWEQPSVQDNIERLRSRGVIVVDPGVGHLAGGDHGPGRLADTDVMMAAIDAALAGTAQSKLAGRTVLVTAGGTREPVDPVRFIGNRSSGKQGHAVAQEARRRGANVVLVTAASLAVAAAAGIDVRRVETAAEMHDEVLARLPECDVVVMAAAVADFRPVEIASDKIKKSAGVPEIRLEPTADVLAAVAEKRRDDQVVVGFAAETSANDVDLEIEAKLRRKRLDVVVANNVLESGAGFEHDTNSVTILDRFGQKYETGLVEKRTVASSLLDVVERLL